MFQKDTNPKTARQMLPAVLSGILASLCWIIGDLLIVGFTPAPEKYPLLSEAYASQIDVGLATLMLSGSTNRLMWGALMAVFSVPFYLYSTFAVSRLIKRKFMMPVFLLLLLGFAYAPLGHAAFFYVGEIYKAVINTDVSAHAQLLQTAAGFVRILKICWTVSAGFTAVGWLVFGIMVASGKTLLKRNAVWLNPIMFFIGIGLLSLLLSSPLKDRIGCAIFNEAHLVFFATLLFIVLRKRHSANARTVSNLNNKQRGNGRKKLIDNGIKGWLSEQYRSVKKTTVGFPDFVNPRYLTGDNRKYLKMYRWLSPFYDMTEKLAERLWSHHRIAEMRRQLMDKLEWRNGLSVLCVSVGTGRDFDFFPTQIDAKTLKICGADINADMMKRCRKKWSGKLDLTLVRCCAEELPFRDECFDIVFHFGGINFFNDKQKAIGEMIRVAKSGSKLLIADETNDLIKGGYNKLFFSRRYFKDAQINVETIEKAIPEHVTEKKTDYLWDGRIYCMTFRKE